MTKIHTTITIDYNAWLNALNIIGQGNISKFINNILLDLQNDKSKDIKIDLEKLQEEEIKIKLQKQILVGELETQNKKEQEEKMINETKEKELEQNKNKCKYCFEFINGKSRKCYSTEFSTICLDCVKDRKEARQEVGLMWKEGKANSTTVKERDYN